MKNYLKISTRYFLMGDDTRRCKCGTASAPCPCKRAFVGQAGKRVGMAAKVHVPGISVGFPLLSVPSGSGLRAAHLSSPSQQLGVGTQPAFPRDEGRGCFPASLSSSCYLTYRNPLHEQDALHHHLSGQAGSSAANHPLLQPRTH